MYIAIGLYSMKCYEICNPRCQCLDPGICVRGSPIVAAIIYSCRPDTKTTESLPKLERAVTSG